MRIAKKNLSLTEAAPTVRPTVRVCRAWMNLLQKYQNTIKTQNKIAKMGEELPILKGILKGNVNYHNARKLSIDYWYQTQTPAPKRDENKHTNLLQPRLDFDSLPLLLLRFVYHLPFSLRFLSLSRSSKRHWVLCVDLV